MLTRTTRRRYSDEFRAAALALLDANGGNLDRAARQLKVPRKTLAGWASGRNNPVPAELRHQKRADLTAALEQHIAALCGIRPEHVENLNLKDAAIAMGIAVDKYLLLRQRAEQERPAGKSEYDLERLTPKQLRQLADIAEAARGEPPIEHASDLNNPVVAPWAEQECGS